MDIPYKDMISAYSVNFFVSLILYRELLPRIGNSTLNHIPTSTVPPRYPAEDHRKYTDTPQAYIVNVSSHEGIFENIPTASTKNGKHVECCFQHNHRGQGRKLLAHASSCNEHGGPRICECGARVRRTRSLSKRLGRRGRKGALADCYGREGWQGNGMGSFLEAFWKCQGRGWNGAVIPDLQNSHLIFVNHSPIVSKFETQPTFLGSELSTEGDPVRLTCEQGRKRTVFSLIVVVFNDVKFI